jgi:hypothetical protein
MQLPAVLGVTARYQGGAGLGTTAYSYWVQAIYPEGSAQLSAAATTSAKCPSALSGGNFIAVNWNFAPGAIGFLVWRNTTGNLPKTGDLVIFIASSETGFKDDGSASTTATTPRYDGLYMAKAVYNFAVDGGAVGVIIPALSDTIPANAIVLGGTVNSPTAVLAAAGAATISIGTSAGSGAATILAATSKASFSIDAIQNYLAGTGPFGAASFKMSAAGQIQLTVATNPLTAGVVEIFVFFVIAANS